MRSHFGPRPSPLMPSRRPSAALVWQAAIPAELLERPTRREMANVPGGRHRALLGWVRSQAWLAASPNDARRGPRRRHGQPRVAGGAIWAVRACPVGKKASVRIKSVLAVAGDTGARKVAAAGQAGKVTPLLRALRLGMCKDEPQAFVRVFNARGATAQNVRPRCNAAAQRLKTEALDPASVPRLQPAIARTELGASSAAHLNVYKAMRPATRALVGNFHTRRVAAGLAPRRRVATRGAPLAPLLQWTAPLELTSLSAASARPPSAPWRGVEECVVGPRLLGATSQKAPALLSASSHSHADI